MRRASCLLLFLLLAFPFPAAGRSRAGLTANQQAMVRQQIRAQAEWQFALLEGRRPMLKTTIRKVAGSRDQFTAKAEILALWRGARAPLASNQFTITRQPNGSVIVSSRQPFLPR